MYSLVNSWYQKHPVRFLLWPISLCYQLVVYLRQQAYKLAIFNSHKLPVPVIVVGNISVGGTGKTPFVLWLAKQLVSAGYKPGIISRGYGGQSQHYPLAVSDTTAATECGDEPLLLAKHSQCPIVVAPNRSQAGQYLLKQFDCNIIITDDGLQHYALQRDIEIVVVDAERLFGNQMCLPAGPLREPLSRLEQVDFIVYNGGDDNTSGYNMSLTANDLVNIKDPELTLPVDHFSGKHVHAVAGIGHPQRFFNTLSAYSMDIIPHAFADHYAYSQHDFEFDDQLPIVMTEKDAVKCHSFSQPNYWYLSVSAELQNNLSDKLLHKIKEINNE